MTSRLKLFTEVLDVYGLQHLVENWADFIAALVEPSLYHQSAEARMAAVFLTAMIYRDIGADVRDYFLQSKHKGTILDKIFYELDSVDIGLGRELP